MKNFLVQFLFIYLYSSYLKVILIKIYKLDFVFVIRDCIFYKYILRFDTLPLKGKISAKTQM